MDSKAATLQVKADGLLREYQRLDRIAMSRRGDSRQGLLERMADIRNDFEALISQISRLKNRVPI